METELYKAPLQPLTASSSSASSTSSHEPRRSSTLLYRLFIAAALLSLYAIYNCRSAMPSQDVDLSNYTDSIFLPFIYKFNSQEVPQVSCVIEGVAIEMPVDTGSTGILVGAPILPRVDPKAGEPAHHFFTSSRILYAGRLVDLQVGFHGESGAFASARVPVLVVDKSWWCPWYKPDRDGRVCPAGPNGEKAVERDTSQITYMGVGFGRNCPRDGMPIAAPEVNAFLNINAINGHPVSARSMRAGYVVSTWGIHVGLTLNNTRGHIMERLDPGCTHEKDARDWAMPKACFNVNGGKPSCGSVLVDTGIAQMYIRAEEGTSIPNITIPNPNPKGHAKMVKRVKPGTKIAVGFPSLRNAATCYSFVVGEKSCVQPSYVVPEEAAAPAFVNTGRNFLFWYSVLFDAVGGQFGIRAVTPSSCALL